MKEFKRLSILMMIALLAVGVGCSSGGDTREDSAPQDVVGDPPSEDDEDYEFATPPKHPGTHGDISEGAGEPIERSDEDPDVIYGDEIARLKRFGPSVVLEHVRTEPNHKDGDFVGFEIVEVSGTAQRYIEPKLQVGDVITHVNLVRLEMPDDYMEAWETLEDAEEIRVDFVRDGEPSEAVWEVQ